MKHNSQSAKAAVAAAKKEIARDKGTGDAMRRRTDIYEMRWVRVCTHKMHRSHDGGGEQDQREGERVKKMPERCSCIIYSRRGLV